MITRRNLVVLSLSLFSLFCTGCGGTNLPQGPIVVNSLEDILAPSAGTVTLRSALDIAASGQIITFDETLDDGRITLTEIADEHTILKGEVMGIRDEASGPVSYLVGYQERDYGASALYARKDVVIDASNLSSGITIACTDTIKARVLAVYGNLTMKNVSMTGGVSLTDEILDTNSTQIHTLGRGGAAAVWGIATLTDCKFFNNICVGDFDDSRDRGAFGGGLFADMVYLTGCTFSGNTVIGAGAAGGGVYSVGGANVGSASAIVKRCSISGNVIMGMFAYGGGIYSDGGGIGNSKSLKIYNSTIARNLVKPFEYIPSFLLAMGYWRGGAAYISNGSLRIENCTIVENEVHGVPRELALGKPNMAGAVAATIGNAHAVEKMTIGRSIISGNTVNEVSNETTNIPNDYLQVIHSYDHDVFTGSLTNFNSLGHNLIGVIDFSQILVPVEETEWLSLCRRHFPQIGDTVGVSLSDVVDLTISPLSDPLILSVGVSEQTPAPIAYTPKAFALDQIPTEGYNVSETLAELSVANGVTNDFLWILLQRLEAHYGLDSPAPGFAETFKQDFETFLKTDDADVETSGRQPYADPLGNIIEELSDTHWFGPAETWPKELPNYAYIEFWHQLDEALIETGIPGMGPETLNDDVWSDLFDEGALVENTGISIKIETSEFFTYPDQKDQMGYSRPRNTLGDIGSIEIH